MWHLIVLTIKQFYPTNGVNKIDDGKKKLNDLQVFFGSDERERHANSKFCQNVTHRTDIPLSWVGGKSIGTRKKNRNVSGIHSQKKNGIY